MSKDLFFLRCAVNVKNSKAWLPMGEFPGHGEVVLLRIPYSPPQIDFGFWDGECFRFSGDDGPCDIQPSGWRKIPCKAEILGAMNEK